MNRVVLLGCLLLFMNLAEAQVKKEGLKARTTKKTQGSKIAIKSNTSKPTGTILLSSERAYAARSGMTASPASLSIADPVVITLNQRAKGAAIRQGSSPIMGMPKRTYGFRNGRILLRSTDSPTSGTSTGTASVGTGSSLGSMGSNAAVAGVNGKSPEAGSAMWGHTRGLMHPYLPSKN